MSALLALIALSLALPFVTARADCPHKPYTAIEWDFDLGPHGFTTVSCGGAPVWEWGLETQQKGAYEFGLPVRCWSTVLNGNYPNNAGQGLLSPPFRVKESSRWAEVDVYYSTEWGGAPWLGGNPDTTMDGFNVKVNGVLVKPCNVTGPPHYLQESVTAGGVISNTALHQTACVDGEPGEYGCEEFPDGCNFGMRFDLLAFMGQSVRLRVDFGSDEATNYTGVLVTRVALVGDVPDIQGPDIAIVPEDISFSDLPGGAKQVTATVRNHGRDTTNVGVRFLALDPNGSGQPVALGPDQTIASLPEGGASQVQTVWTPGSNQDELYVFVDPTNAFEELDELNNTAHKSFNGVAPVITGVTAQYDGNDSPDIVGTFMDGITGSNNKFTATVTDGNNDVARVEFTIGSVTIVDDTPADGWTATFDMGALGADMQTAITDDIPLAVVAIDAAGAHSQIKIITIDMFPMPAWMITKLSFAGFPVSFEGGFCKVGFELTPDGAVGNLLDYVYTFGGDMFMIGGTHNKFGGGVEGELSVPLSPFNVGPRISAKLKITQEYFDKPVERELTLQVSLNPDYSVESVAFSWQAEVELISIETERYIPLSPPLVAVLGIGLDLFGRLNVGVNADASFDNVKVTFSPGLSAQINFTAGLSLAGLIGVQVVGSPRFNCDHTVEYKLPAGTSASTSGTWEVRWSLQGCVLFGNCVDLAQGAWGPYTLFDPFAPDPTARGSSLASEFAAMEPQALVDPDLRSGPGNRLGMVWIRDVDPNPARVDPDVVFAYADSAGNWSAAIPVTGPTGPDPFFQLGPTLAFEPGGGAVTAWIQNRLTEPMVIANPPSLATVLTNQDIFFARWNGVSWSTPTAVVADAAGTLRADGTPAVAVAPSGQGMLLWTRCLTDQSLDQGNREIYYATYDSTSGFASPIRLTFDARDDHDPAVAAGTGRIMGVWLKDVVGGALGASDNDVVGAVWNGAAWSAVATIASDGNIHRDPSVAMLVNGDAVAAWTSMNILPDSQAVYTVETSTWNHTTGLWSAPEPIHASPLQIETPRVNADARQIAVVTWRGHDGYDGDLFASMKDLDDPLSHWTAPDTLTQDSLTDWMLACAVDEQNNLHFVDLKTDLSNVSAMVNKGEFFDGLAFGSKGIGADLTLEDPLNFGFVALAADLKGAGSIQPSAAWPVLGQPDTLRLAVTNIGAVVSAASIVRFTDGHPDSGGTVFATKPLAALYPGDTTTVVAIWPALAGTHTLWAWIDPLNAVSEQTESNNKIPVTLSTVPNPRAVAVWTDPTSPLPGAVTIRGAVSNTGGLDANSVRVRLLVGAQTVLDTLIVGLSRNETDTVAVAATLPSGVSALTLAVDPLGVLFESDEGDNTATGEARILPDLEIPAYSLALGTPNGSTSRWSAVVHNTGGVAAGAFTVTFYAGHPLNQGVRLGQTVVNSLAARDSVPVHVDTATWPGITTLYVFADSAEAIAERIENNNGTNRVVNFVPDLALASSDITVTGSSTPLDVVVTIHNIGSAQALGVTAWLYQGHPDSGGVFLGGSTVTSIGAGATQQAHIDLALANSSPRWLYVQLDREAAITEQQESNNIAGIWFDPTALPPVVISQVYGGGGASGSTYRSDFIEIFNRSNDPVNVTGWSVQYASATTGSTWAVTPITGTLQGGGFLLVKEAGTSLGAVLPTADVTGTINMASAGGKVALVGSTTAISGCPTLSVDLVGYGASGTCFEGSGRAPAGNNNQAIKRLLNGCRETNDNAVDFGANTPTPRNSSSPKLYCVTSSPSGAGAATPGSVPAGGQVLLTVVVTTGVGPSSTGLATVVDLTSIGGASSATMYDDGTHGDGVAADLVFSLQATVSALTSPGSKNLPFTVSDAQSRTGPGSIGVEVTASTGVPSTERVEFGIRNVGQNPAPGAITLTVGLPSAATARLDLIDVAGRRIMSRDIGGLGPGMHRVTLHEAVHLEPGIYLLRLTQSGKVATGRVVLIH